MKVIVIGGSGHFGRLLIEDLRRYTPCDIAAPPRTVVDLRDPASIDKALFGTAIAICAAGPFQALPLTLAEKCIERGVHYIDLADDRGFVRNVRSIASRKDMRSAVCSGWSTTPALTSCLVRIAAAGLEQVDDIYIHMAPGNRLPRGTATVASLLHSVGRPLEIFRDGRWQTAYGWSDRRSFSFPSPVGERAGYLVDAPDHELLPELFHAKTVEFRAASELGVLNTAVSVLAWGVRIGMVHDWTAWKRSFHGLAALFGSIGHEWGAIGVEVSGLGGGRRVVRRASVVANCAGQRIAVMPATVMTSLLLTGSNHCGWISPKDWLMPEQLADECARRGFRLSLEET